MTAESTQRVMGTPAGDSDEVLRLSKPFAIEVPIREIGQEVMKSLMLQLLLQDLPLVDVVDRADHPQGFSRLPTDHLGLAMNPAYLAVRPDYTVFKVVGLVLVERCADSLPEQISVVRVHNLDQLLVGRD